MIAKTLPNRLPLRHRHRTGPPRALAKLGRSFHTRRAPAGGLLLLALGAVASMAGLTAAAEPPATGSVMAQAYHDRGEFDGVVLVAEGAKVRCLRAFGPVGPGKDATALTPQTVFPICSVTKQFTAVLVLQLMDEGKLRLESTLSEVLPDFRTDEPGQAVTVRQLLTHASGLPSLEEALPEVEGLEGFYRLADLDFARPFTVLERYLRGPLRFAPGSRFDYNNADYWVLGAILERLSGKTYETSLNERLLGPLGMTHSGLCTPKRPLPAGSAEGQVRDPKSGQKGPGPKLQLENFWAAGAMFSTAEDLLRWDVAVDEGRLLSAAAQAAMVTPDPKLGFVALGSWVYRTAVPGTGEKVLLVERQGEIGAFHALSLRLPEQHGHILLLSNLDVADLNSTYMKKGLPFGLVEAFIQAVVLTP